MGRKKHSNLVGRRIGKLVVERLEKNAKKQVFWLCRCDCGGTKIATTGHLNTGSPTSCGCNFHGHATNNRPSREYVSYNNMMNRCHKESNSRFADYGGKGITVCSRWRDGFRLFIADMGLCPTGMQIDRIDNTKGYSPENCRWATRKQNQQNRKETYWWHVYGVTYGSAQDAGIANGVSGATIQAWCSGRITSDGRRYLKREGCGRSPKYPAAMDSSRISRC